MALIDITKQSYSRPDSAKSYISFHKVAVDVKDSALQEYVTLPTLSKLRPMNYRWYAESTDAPGGAAAVMCSGNLFLNTTLDKVGVLKRDAKPGDTVALVLEGTYALPLDYANLTAAEISALNGKAAYYLVASGLLSDTDPGGGAALKIGYFTEVSETNLSTVTSGVKFAHVRLDPTIENTAVSLPADAATGFTTEHFVEASISALDGLNQWLTVDLGNANPNYPFAPHQVAWTVEGTAIGTGFSIEAAFTAGSGKTIAVTVTDGAGGSTTKNYTVTISASAAPSAFTEV